MKDLLRHLEAELESDPSPDRSVMALLGECVRILELSQRDGDIEKVPAMLETLLTAIIKPLFLETARQSQRRTAFSEDYTKQWRDSAPWCLEVLRWTLDQYGTLHKPLLKPTIESHMPLLVPPILTLLDDDLSVQKGIGCRLLDILSSHIASCQSDVLRRTGLTKVFEDSLAPNMLLLPSLTQEAESLEVLNCLYPAYRSLIQASFVIDTAKTHQGRAGFSSSTPSRHPGSRRAQAVDLHNEKQAMLDRILRSGLLVGYVHASDYVQIASLLVSEMSPVIELMGMSAAKYLSRLLPLLRNILTNPLGSAYPPLLKAGLVTLRQLILQCWPRIRDFWWEECLRTVIGLWLVLCDDEENDDTLNDLKKDAKGLISLLRQVKGPAECQTSLGTLQAQSEVLEELLSTG